MILYEQMFVKKGSVVAAKIAVVGTGHMGRSAISILADYDAAFRFVIFDRSEENLDLASKSGGVIEARHCLDLFSDPLDFSGMDLVLNFAGPFFSGSNVVALAAIAAGAPYVDVGDDVEATQAILSLDREAREAGVPLITGAGLSPGVSNWIAMQILADDPECDEIKIAWVNHEPNPGGLAPLRHMLHMAVVPCPVWEGGRMVDSPGFVPATSESFDFPEPFGRIEAQDASHPEPFTLSRAFPRLDRIRCKGSLRPDWANAAFSTLGKIGFGYHEERISYGDLEIEPAEFLWRLMWQRYRRRPSREDSPHTAVMVQGIKDGVIRDSRCIIDNADMSRGTGLGAVAAAIVLLSNRPAPGASGVEALDPDMSIKLFLELSAAQGAFSRGIIHARDAVA